MEKRTGKRFGLRTLCNPLLLNSSGDQDAHLLHYPLDMDLNQLSGFHSNVRVHLEHFTILLGIVTLQLNQPGNIYL
ncbi:hypothetical protein D3C73_1538070 [compost metagenome]